MSHMHWSMTMFTFMYNILIENITGQQFDFHYNGTIFVKSQQSINCILNIFWWIIQVCIITLSYFSHNKYIWTHMPQDKLKNFKLNQTANVLFGSWNKPFSHVMNLYSQKLIHNTDICIMNCKQIWYSHDSNLFPCSSWHYQTPDISL